MAKNLRRAILIVVYSLLGLGIGFAVPANESDVLPTDGSGEASVVFAAVGIAIIAIDRLSRRIRRPPDAS